MVDSAAVGRALAHGASDAQARAQGGGPSPGAAGTPAGDGSQGTDSSGTPGPAGSDAPGGEPSLGKKALAKVGAVFGALTSAEQSLSTLLSGIPMPAFPAARITDTAVGIPHAHSHPPNLIPPAPPVPFPVTGPIIKIPFVSGADKVWINNLPAARCGDMGVNIWCGGFFPMYEIFLGSSSVWIQGQRAARLGVDMTKHCVFSTPKPNDLPLGPMIGVIVTGSPNVIIGGVPLPSLTNMAVGLAFKAVFAGVGKVVKAVRAARAAAAAEKAAQEAAQEATAKASGQLPRNVALLSEADPARRVLGPAAKSHPEEIAKMRKALDNAGVEVIERPGAMAYSPGLRKGEPGQFVIDPDASLSAWTHEYQHVLDDQAAGWSGMRILGDSDARWAREQAAYGKEIEMMEQMGHHDVADELRQGMETERKKIFGEFPEAGNGGT